MDSFKKNESLKPNDIEYDLLIKEDHFKAGDIISDVAITIENNDVKSTKIESRLEKPDDKPIEDRMNQRGDINVSRMSSRETASSEEMPVNTYPIAETLPVNGDDQSIIILDDGNSNSENGYNMQKKTRKQVKM